MVDRFPLTRDPPDGEPTRLKLENGGLILARCPGRDHTAKDDVARFSAYGAGLLLSLVEPHEFADHGGLATALAVAGIAFCHMPVADFGVPEAQAWATVSTDLHERLDLGEIVAIHCWSGLGRTGTIAARLLVGRGVAPELAITTVRNARPGAIETAGQLAWAARPV